jgi:hypothetical protein
VLPALVKGRDGGGAAASQWDRVLDVHALSPVAAVLWPGCAGQSALKAFVFLCPHKFKSTSTQDEWCTFQVTFDTQRNNSAFATQAPDTSAVATAAMTAEQIEENCVHLICYGQLVICTSMCRYHTSVQALTMPVSGTTAARWQPQTLHQRPRH